MDQWKGMVEWTQKIIFTEANYDHEITLHKLISTELNHS